MLISIDAGEMLGILNDKYQKSLAALFSMSPNARETLKNDAAEDFFSLSSMQDKLLRFDKESANGEKCQRLNAMRGIANDIKQMRVNVANVAARANALYGEAGALFAGMNYLMSLEAVDNGLSDACMRCGVLSDKHSDLAAIARTAGWDKAKLDFASSIVQSVQSEKAEAEVEKAQ